MWNRLVSETFQTTLVDSHNFELPPISKENPNFEEKCLEFFIKEARNGKKLRDLVRGCIDQKEGKMQRILQRNYYRLEREKPDVW